MESQNVNDPIAGLEELLTKAEAGKILRISVSSLDRLIAAGAIRVIRLGHLVRIEPAELRRIRAEGGTK